MAVWVKGKWAMWRCIECQCHHARCCWKVNKTTYSKYNDETGFVWKYVYQSYLVQALVGTFPLHDRIETYIPIYLKNSCLPSSFIMILFFFPLFFQNKNPELERNSQGREKRQLCCKCVHIYVGEKGKHKELVGCKDDSFVVCVPEKNNKEKWETGLRGTQSRW